MIAVIDYGAGNLRSVCNALDFLRCAHSVTASTDEIAAADGVILPGVGAFGAAMEEIERRSLRGTIRQAALSGRPFLGICLGMQLLFESSEETPDVEGLSILPGTVLRFPDEAMRAQKLKVPHMGWNSLCVKPEARLFQGCGVEPYVYFVHSFYVRCERERDVAATCEYGLSFHASVEHGNVFGCQFHPEKSAETGRQILRNFAALCASDRTENRTEKSTGGMN